MPLCPKRSTGVKLTRYLAAPNAYPMFNMEPLTLDNQRAEHHGYVKVPISSGAIISRDN